MESVEYSRIVSRTAFQGIGFIHSTGVRANDLNQHMTKPARSRRTVDWNLCIVLFTILEI